MRERTIFTVIVLAIILLVIGYLVATSLDITGLLPRQASTRSLLVDDLFRFMLGIATVIFLVVEGALIFAVFRFRQKPGDLSDAVAIHGNNSLEVIWTLIPAFIVLVIGVYSYRVLSEIEQPGEDPLVVKVISRQFLWEFEYPEAGVKSQILHLPVNQPVQFQIETKDVIHSFWVPDFRVKRDATPGQIDELLITPSEIGRYPIRCAELCGAGHAAMISEVIVETELDFIAWLSEAPAQPVATAPPTAEAEPTSEPVVDVAVEGRDLFAQFGCIACHVLQDAGGIGLAGPSLEGIGSAAETRIPGLGPREYLIQSIRETDAYIVEGYSSGLMPHDFSQRISEDQLEILVGYLLTQ